MDNFEIATGKTVDEAVDNACAKLGVSRDNITYEILEWPQKKLFGLKVLPAKVKVSVSEDFSSKYVGEKKTENKEETPCKKENNNCEKQKPLKEKQTAPKAKEKKEESKATVKEVITEPAKEENKEEAADEAKQEVKVLPPEVLEQKGSAAASYIKDILLALGFADADVTYSQNNGMIVLQLSGDNIGAIVGRRGDNLDAMQYLASLVANKSEGSYVRVVLDVDDYRKKREESLKSYARKMANQAVRSGRSITLEPMNPYERRIVHSSVQTVNGATSKSIGTEPNRKVVISPIDGGKGRKDGRRDGRRGDKSRSQHHDSPKSVNKVQETNEQPKNDTSAISLYGRIDLS